MITVLVVDDSLFFRSTLSRMLSNDPEITVIDTAKDGEEALEKIKKLNPDVVTLDVEMPRRDGLSTLQVIMAEMPRPVIMVSTLTAEGAETTLKALDIGAVDFVPKFQAQTTTVNTADIGRELCEKVKAVGHKHLGIARRLRAQGAKAACVPLAGTAATTASGTFSKTTDKKAGATSSAPFSKPLVRSTTTTVAGASVGSDLRKRVQEAVQNVPKQGIASATAMRGKRQTRDYVAIGVSTGGPPAVQKVLAALPADFPASILIAQHMPGTFTGPFAKRLDSVSKIHVKEAENGDRLQKGVAYVAPGGKHLRVDMKGAAPQIFVVGEPAEALYKPSATVLFESLAQNLGRRTLGVIMTGMGSDGCIGMQALKNKNAYVLAQSEASCVVYGMPKAVIDANLADEIVDIDNLAEAIMMALYK